MNDPVSRFRFLDDLAEFGRGAIEVMRQPLEEATVTIARAAGTFTYPARFQLAASMSPYPCGYRGLCGAECRRDDASVAKYVGKLSGPLRDRIDLLIEIARVPDGEAMRLLAHASAKRQFFGARPRPDCPRRANDRRSGSVREDSRGARCRGIQYAA